jgi:hypothetical protein
MTAVVKGRRITIAKLIGTTVSMSGTTGMIAGG